MLVGIRNDWKIKASWKGQFDLIFTAMAQLTDFLPLYCLEVEVVYALKYSICVQVCNAFSTSLFT